MKTVVLIGTLVLFPIALVTGVKTLYHWWFVVTGVRRDKVFTASVLGPFCLLMPSLFEQKAQHHLRRLNPWLLMCVVSSVLLLGLRALGEHLR